MKKALFPVYSYILVKMMVAAMSKVSKLKKVDLAGKAKPLIVLLQLSIRKLS